MVQRANPRAAPGSGPAPPRAAYIHVPFCRHRCGYCNFTLVAGRDELVDDYLRAIALELAALGTPREVDTLYFGGGTPTQLAADKLRRLAETVIGWHPLSDGYEWTVEANPADVDAQRIAALRRLGVTRISLGGQSFRPAKLRLLERDHGPAEIARAVALAHDAGMQVALDLIFATPGETLAQWQADIEAAVALAPHHVSAYGLTFEPGTAFWNRRQRGELVEADELLQSEMYAAVIDRLPEAGLEHYEVSSFARPGCRSRHNQTYWSGDGYWAAGPGAARYVDGVRQTNHRSVTKYLRQVLAGRSPVAEAERLAPAARAREQLVFGLRRLNGVDRREFAARCGFEIDALEGEAIKKFTALGLLADDGRRVRFTREGLFVSDAICAELV